jgi:nucleotide-binding universal stress UspA family protein
MALVDVREVLVPTDLSSGGEVAISHARLLAERLGAHLTLYHAVQIPDHRFAHWAFSKNHVIWIQAEKDARHALERCAVRIGNGCKVEVERTGSAHRAIAAYIKKAQPDLTVMATHGQRGRDHLGSVTEQVLRRSYRPILCVHAAEDAAAEAPAEVQPYRCVLVPTDFSLASRLVFPMAMFLARAFGAEILAVHVRSERALEPREPVVPTEAVLRSFLERDFAGLEVRAQVHSGSVWERIVHVARVEKADLIVMSTHGHDSLADDILGSNADRVVRNATCPVLVA